MARSPRHLDFALNYEPHNATQVELFHRADTAKIVFALGQAGTGKSFACLAHALSGVKSGRFDSVTLVRPALAAEEDLGFLPGEVVDKIAPYQAIFTQLLSDMAFTVPPNILRAIPLCFLRGITFRNTAVVIDEAQNLTRTGFRLIITRLGRGARLYFAGDPDQSDLPRRASFLRSAADRLSHLPGVQVYTFLPRDNLRDSLVNDVLRLL